ncbi:MAG TPA: hypothetical protein PKL63_06560 [Dermatophilaceae bacterium]|nr:hypothetical protein [Dermatophilaceae bacterium]
MMFSVAARERHTGDTWGTSESGETAYLGNRRSTKCAPEKSRMKSPLLPFPRQRERLHGRLPGREVFAGANTGVRRHTRGWGSP